jgi:hypothetical protein
LETVFDFEIYEAVKVFSASPLRLSRPSFKAFDKGFIAYASLTNFPEPLGKRENNKFTFLK